MFMTHAESLHLIGWNHSLTNQFASQLAALETAVPNALLLRIVVVHKEWLELFDGHTHYRARALPRLSVALAEDGYHLAVGDWVIAESNAQNELWISQRLSPINHISRRSFDGRRQSVASNIDTALLVMGLDHDFSLRRLERYIALVLASQVMLVIILTKADTVDNAETRMQEIRQRIGQRYPIFAVNALDANSMADLTPWLGSGQTLCLLGSSGAGKSTLTNTLTAAQQQTGAIRADDSRGRHTTTARSLHRCISGACIIDAPGLRTLRPDGDESCIEAAFDDIEQWAEQCQFRDCRHEAEPGCAVRQHCDPDRLFNYHKLMRDMQRSQQTPLERIAERSRWKTILTGVRSHNKRRQQ